MSSESGTAKPAKDVSGLKRVKAEPSRLEAFKSRMAEEMKTFLKDQEQKREDSENDVLRVLFR